MTFEEDFLASLLADHGVAAIIGTRASWAELPQARQRPLAVLWNTTSAPGYTMAGSDGLFQAFIQIDAWASTYAEAKALARAIHAWADSLRGTVGQTAFQGVFVRAERDMGDEPAAGSPAERDSRVILDSEVWFG